MLTPEEIAAVDAEREAVHQAMPNIGTVTEEELDQWHVQNRCRDAQRIANGEATAAQVSRENSFLPPEAIQRAVLLNFEEVLLAMT